MEKHEKCKAKGRGASLGRVAGGLLRVPSLQYSNPGLLYKRSQSVGELPRQTKPIGRRLPGGRDIQYSSTPSFRRPSSPAGAGCTNEANWPRMGREDHHRGLRPWRCHPPSGTSVRQTRPICFGRVRKTIPKAGGLEDATRPGSKRANEANPGRAVVQTNPIGGGATAPNEANRQGTCRTNKANRCRACCTNEANLAWMGREDHRQCLRPWRLPPVAEDKCAQTKPIGR